MRMALTKTTRRVIFYASVALFLLATPVIILYSLGYTVNIQDKTIQTTGGIFVKTVMHPGFTIFLDGVFYKETSFLSRGALVTDLRPGYHSVAVAKDGYLPWTKNVLVESRRVAEFRFIVLVPEPQNQAHIATTTPHISDARFLLRDVIFESTSPLAPPLVTDPSFASAGNTRHLLSANLTIADWNEEQNRILFVRTDPTTDSAFWSIGILADNSYEERWKRPTRFFVKTNTATTTPRILEARGVRRIALDPERNDGIFILDTSGTVYRGSTASNDITPFVPNVAFFSPVANALAFIDTNGFLASADTQSDAIAVIGRRGFFLKPNVPPQFARASSEALAIIDSAGGLFLQEPGSPELAQVDSGARGMMFDKTGAKLLVWKEQEIFVHWLKEQEQQPQRAKNERSKIVLWPEVTIKKAIWQTNTYEHIIFSTQNGLFLSDVDNRGGLNIQKITDGPIIDFIYDKKEKRLRWLDEKHILEIEL